MLIAFGLVDVAAGLPVLLFRVGNVSSVEDALHAWPILVPALLILGLAVASIAAAGIASRRGTPLPRGVPVGIASLHVAVGAATFSIGFFLYSFLFLCGDPGGCSEMFVPFWPLLLPGLALLASGIVGLLLVFPPHRARERAGPPPPPS